MVLLGVLVILWAVLIGSWLKERASTRTGDSVSAFRDQLSTLQRTQPEGHRSGLRPVRSPDGVRVAAFGPGRPPSLRGSDAGAPLRRRRRDVLLVLAGATAFSFIVAFVVGGLVFFALNALCVVALVAYVAALLQQQRIAQEKRVKVRYLPSQSVAIQRTVARPQAAAGARPGRVPAGGRGPAEAALLRRTVAN